MISSKSEGLGTTATGIVKLFYDSPSQPIDVFGIAVSCCGPILIEIVGVLTLRPVQHQHRLSTPSGAIICLSAVRPILSQNTWITLRFFVLISSRC